MRFNLQSPKPLKKGDTIGVIAPSAGIAALFPHRVERGIDQLEKLGFRVKLSANALGMSGFVSATAEKRADDIHEMFADDNVKAIMATIGGDHSNQVLKHLDFELIKKNPKFFIGYSDISVIHYALISKANLETYYGPCVMTQFGEFPRVLDYTKTHFLQVLTNNDADIEIAASEEWTDEVLDWSTKDDLSRPRLLTESSGYEWLRHGQSEGRVLGGCIPSINHLAGTEYWIDPKESIFFIDLPEGNEVGVGISIADVDSYLADLDNLGVFRSVNGLVIGRPYRYDSDQIKQLKAIIHKYTRDTTYPILMNTNIGHTDPIITLPLGRMASLDSEKNKFTIGTSVSAELRETN